VTRELAWAPSDPVVPRANILFQGDESQMSQMFDVAINNFYSASIGRSSGAPINTIALGLQQLSGAIRQQRPNSQADTLLQTANSNFYSASIASTTPMSPRRWRSGCSN
jgi:hypothetical protein